MDVAGTIAGRKESKERKEREHSRARDGQEDASQIHNSQTQQTRRRHAGIKTVLFGAFRRAILRRRRRRKSARSINATLTSVPIHHTIVMHDAKIQKKRYMFHFISVQETNSNPVIPSPSVYFKSLLGRGLFLRVPTCQIRCALGLRDDGSNDR